MCRRFPLDARRSDFAGARRPASGLFPRRLLGPRRGAATSSRFLASTALLVDGLPRPLLGHSLGGALLFIALFDVFRFTLLLVGIFDFGSSRHEKFPA